MASIPCTIHTHISFPYSCSSSSRMLRSPFFAFTKSLGWRRPCRLMKRADLAGGGGGARCWFKFGNRGVDAEDAGIYGSQSRDDFDRDDVEQGILIIGKSAPAMGFVSGVVDSVIVLFSAVLVLAAPLIDAQTCLPTQFFPPALINLRRWYIEEFDDYLLKENPHFFVGLAWIEIFFIWPLSIANVYGILSRRPWVATTSLITGVSIVTSMAPLMGELLGSGRSSDKLLQIYFPFVAFSVLAILKGLFSGSLHTVTKASHAPSARKKRA